MSRSIKYKGCSLLFMICWPILIIGQHLNFIDSLFQVDLTNLKQNEYLNAQNSIDRLKKDYGISVGLGISNFNSEEFDSGLSTRAYARLKLWANGLKDNQLEAEMLRKELILDSLNNKNINLDFNYGLYYDYIIFLFNQKKLSVIDSIQKISNTHLNHLYELYYDKIIDYNQLLDIKEIISNFGMLKESHVSYNKIFNEIIEDIDLPQIKSSNIITVDFEALNDKILSDTTYKDAIYLEHNLIDDQYEQSNLADLSITMGYDLSRHRTYYSFNCSKKLWKTSSKEKEGKKKLIIEEYRAQNIQKQKELINIKYEYDYKIKQLNDLHFRRKELNERRRILKVKRSILSLNESIEERRINIEDQLLEYEITDLTQQVYLQLLKLKRLLPTVLISEFIQSAYHHAHVQKFKAKRYLFVRDTSQLTHTDIIFIQQNELEIIDAFNLMQMQNLIEIHPHKYDSRKDMEYIIADIIKQDPSKVVLFSDLKELKSLELKNLKNNSISSIEIK